MHAVAPLYVRTYVRTEAGEKGKVAEAEGQSSEAGEQEEAVQSFDLGRVRERLAAVRAAEAHRQQRDVSSGFDLSKTRERLAAVRAAEAHKNREAQGEQRSSGTLSGPARQSQQVGGARDPVGLHSSQYGSKSHQGLHWDAGREAWEQPRQMLSSRAARQESWKREEDNSDSGQQARTAPSPGSEDRGAPTHGTTAGACDTQWLRQLEVWGISEMEEACEAQLAEAKAEQRRELEAAEQAPQHMEAQVQCPLAMAGGVCAVNGCEWCDEKSQWGRVQPNEPWGVEGVAGVGE